MKVCPRCSAGAEDDAAYCSKCGHRFISHHESVKLEDNDGSFYIDETNRKKKHKMSEKKHRKLVKKANKRIKKHDRKFSRRKKLNPKVITLVRTVFTLIFLLAGLFLYYLGHSMYIIMIPAGAVLYLVAGYGYCLISPKEKHFFRLSSSNRVKNLALLIAVLTFPVSEFFYLVAAVFDQYRVKGFTFTKSFLAVPKYFFTSNIYIIAFTDLTLACFGAFIVYFFFRLALPFVEFMQKIGKAIKKKYYESISKRGDKDAGAVSKLISKFFYKIYKLKEKRKLRKKMRREKKRRRLEDRMNAKIHKRHEKQRKREKKRLLKEEKQRKKEHDSHSHSEHHSSHEHSHHHHHHHHSHSHSHSHSGSHYKPGTVIGDGEVGFYHGDKK